MIMLAEVNMGTTYKPESTCGLSPPIISKIYI